MKTMVGYRGTPRIVPPAGRGQTGAFTMRPQGSYAIRAVGLGAVALCCAGALYLAFDRACWYGIIPNGPGHEASQPVAIPIDRCLLSSLPDDWEAEWRGGLLWITHRNPDGTAADCLAFGGFEDYHTWVETHPDFCDVNVEDFTAHVWMAARNTQATLCERAGQ